MMRQKEEDNSGCRPDVFLANSQQVSHVAVGFLTHFDPLTSILVNVLWHWLQNSGKHQKNRSIFTRWVYIVFHFYVASQLVFVY